MQITFHKMNPEEYKLHVKRDDGSIDEAVLNYRSFLAHDFVHLALETQAGIKSGFWGQVASGKTLKSLSPKSMKEAGSQPEGDLMLVEIMVGPIQGMLKSGNETIEPIKEYIQSQGLEVPEFFTSVFVMSVLDEVKGYMKRYDEMKVGETMELEFDESQATKSYCSDPKSLANIFSKLNNLGKK